VVAPATEPGASPPPWHIIAERKIQEWIDRGGLDRLPRRGAIRIEERPFVPLELRMACDILERSGFAPDWVVLGKEIETETSDAREAMRRWRFAADRAGIDPTDRAEEQRQREDVARRIAHINGLIARYNVACPVGQLHRARLSLAAPVFQEIGSFA